MGRHKRFNKFALNRARQVKGKDYEDAGLKERALKAEEFSHSIGHCKLCKKEYNFGASLMTFRNGFCSTDCKQQFKLNGKNLSEHFKNDIEEFLKRKMK